MGGGGGEDGGGEERLSLKQRRERMRGGGGFPYVLTTRQVNLGTEVPSQLVLSHCARNCRLHFLSLPVTMS